MKRYIKFNMSRISKYSWSGANSTIETAYTPPSSWYTDVEFLKEVEMKHTFRKWVFAENADSLKVPGDFTASNLVGEPYVVVRNENESSRSKTDYSAFYNVCRHHAAQICDEGIGTLKSTKNRFICPYHGKYVNI